MVSKDKERSRRTSREWYEKNHEAHNEARKERYRQDSSIREAAISRARQYRTRAKNDGAHGERIKHVDCKGTPIQIYSAGYVANVIDRTPQVMRLWEKKGWIPAATFGGKHRYYSGKQVYLLVQLAEAIDDSHGKPSASRLIKGAIQQVHDNWE